MKGVVRCLHSFSHIRLIIANRCVSTSTTSHLSAVRCIISSIDKLPVDDFRCEAFLREEPRLITISTNKSVNTVEHCGIPAARKWFSHNPEGVQILNVPYLEQYGDVILPYELTTFQRFERFHAPLRLFLAASQSFDPLQLYIAQAQILDLPQQLRDDLPTPPVILKAGKGDIYDANIWMGIPPTYTPLHKDPNPNLLVQLAGNKLVRFFRPDIGTTIFCRVQERLQNQASATFRGEEMMQGPERKALEDAVWNCPKGTEGYEIMVRPGDAIFIPKGWWHSIKSIGTGVTASVNWWFR